MNRRIIIENRSELPDIAALDRVQSVISNGRISGPGNRQYCYVTRFTDNSFVYAHWNKASDRFVVTGGRDELD